MKPEKLNNTEYHKKYLDFLWELYTMTYPRGAKFKLSDACRDYNIDKRIMKVLILEKVLWKNKGAYLWSGPIPSVKLVERLVRKMRLSRRKHLKTGKQHINGFKKGAFTQEETTTFLQYLHDGYKYKFISLKLNRQVSLLRRHKYRLKQKGIDVSTKNLQVGESFKKYTRNEPQAANSSTTQLRLV